MYLIGAVHGRADFGPFLTRMKRTGRAVEVGTHRGDFAKTFLASWNGHLTCVDPWAVPSGYESQAAGLYLSDGDRDRDRKVAVASLSRFNPRVAFLRLTSVEAAPQFADGSLDFVYLDGDHRREAVALDLRLWWPKVRRNGVLAGHDICCLPGADNWGDQIQPAVSGFATAVGVDVNLVPESGGEPWSYYLVRER